MKRLILFVLCMMLLCGCGVQTETMFVLSEKVEVIAPATNDSWIDRYTYDSFGNMTACRTYNNDDLQWEELYTYDSQGNQTELLRVFYLDSGNQSTNRFEFIRDDQGRLQTEICWDGDQEVRRTAYTYDDEENSCTYATSDGLVNTTWYDDRGLPVREFRTDEKALYDTLEFLYTYDESGNRLSEETHFDGSLHTRVEWTYDELGRELTSKTSFAKDDYGYQHEWEYDDEAHTGIQTDSRGYRTVASFSEDWQILRSEHYLGSDLQTIETYTYREIRVPANGEE